MQCQRPDGGHAIPGPRHSCRPPVSGKQLQAARCCYNHHRRAIVRVVKVATTAHTCTHPSAAITDAMHAMVDRRYCRGRVPRADGASAAAAAAHFRARSPRYLPHQMFHSQSFGSSNDAGFLEAAAPPPLAVVADGGCTVSEAGGRNSSSITAKAVAMDCTVRTSVDGVKRPHRNTIGRLMATITATDRSDRVACCRMRQDATHPGSFPGSQHVGGGDKSSVEEKGARVGGSCSSAGCHRSFTLQPSACVLLWVFGDAAGGAKYSLDRCLPVLYFTRCVSGTW